MLKKNYYMWIGVIAAIVIAIVGVSAYLTNFQAPSEKIPLKVGTIQITGTLPILVALEKGYFAEEGLDVTNVGFQTSNQLAEAVANGQIDFAGDMSISVIFAIEQRSPGNIKVYATDLHKAESPFTSVIVRNDSSLGINDLEGKKIAVFPGSTATTLTKISFKNLLGKKLNAEYVQMPPNLWLQALEGKQVDAVIAYEPFGTLGLEQGIAKEIYSGLFENHVLPDRSYTPGAFLISPKMINERPDVAQKIIRATQKGVDFINSNNEEARIIATKYLPITENVALKMKIMDFAVGKNMNIENVQKYADILFQEGELNTRIDVFKILYTGG